jgi:Flp pilus assembly protein TadG
MTPAKLDWARDDSGFSALEMVVIFPVTIMMVFGIIQFGIWYHANDIAQAAAQKAAQTASAYNGTQAGGFQVAAQVLEQNADGLILHTHVASARDQQVATVTVNGYALQVIPFIPLPVEATATVPVEAFRPPPRS